MNYAFYNGEYAPYEELKIPLFDRSIYFGDGVYDCMIGANGHVYQEERHIERLRKNARLIHLDFFITDSELDGIIKTLISLSELNCYTVYIQLSRHAEARRHYCKDFARSNVLITVTEASIDFNPKPISLLSYEDVRHRMCNVKTLNLLQSVLASKYAEENGCEEAVFIRDGIVTECAHSNVSILKHGVLYTHPLSRHILDGITRENLLRECKSIGIDVHERCFGYDELIDADEVIVTSTTHFARRAKKIDEICINYGKNTAFSVLSERLLTHFIETCC